MTYSKKHFKDVARILKESKDEIPQVAFEDLMLDFVDLFRAYNPAFDEVIFAEACGVSEHDLVTS
ncbi:MAG: hypothetical protein ACO295_03315 [Sediminibacterium sp.]